MHTHTRDETCAPDISENRAPILVHSVLLNDKQFIICKYVIKKGGPSIIFHQLLCYGPIEFSTKHLYELIIWKLYFLYKGPLRLCHSERKTKLLRLNLWLKEGIKCRLQNHWGSSIIDNQLRIFSLRHTPSFNCICNYRDFVFS